MDGLDGLDGWILLRSLVQLEHLAVLTINNPQIEYFVKVMLLFQLKTHDEYQFPELVCKIMRGMTFMIINYPVSLFIQSQCIH